MAESARSPVPSISAAALALALLQCAPAAVERSEPIGEAQSRLSWVMVRDLVPTETLPYNAIYGFSVAIDGTDAIVGQYAPTGRAQVFSGASGTFDFEATLMPSISTIGPNVAIAQDIAAMSGTIFGNEVLIFERVAGKWSETQVLTGASGFGEALALRGDTLVVGSPTDSSTATGGAVHVYVRSGNAFTEQKKLDPPAGLVAGFGVAVAIDGDTLIAGVGEETYNKPFSPAQVFVRSGTTWTKQAELAPSGPIPMSYGLSLALSGDWAMVGAKHENSGLGGVYIFRRTGSAWTQTQTLDPGSGNFYRFGASIALSGSLGLVGAPKALGSGRVYEIVETSGNWSLGQVLAPPKPLDGADFGDRLAFDPPYGVIGSPENTKDSGNAYVFRGVTPSALGEACTVDYFCESGHCADGVCCDTACTGTCTACTSAKKGQGADGSCGPMIAGTDPESECTEAAGYPGSCGRDGNCDGNGECRLVAPAGTPCGETQCVANAVTGKICDGNGTCSESESECAPALCVGQSCATNCKDDSECYTGAHCDGSACRLPKPVGEACERDEECQKPARCDAASGRCTSGATCNDHVLTTESGEKIDCAPYTCEAAGTCRTQCSSLDECVSPALCDENHACVLPKAAAEDDESGCGCRFSESRTPALPALVLLAFVAALRRRRRFALAVALTGCSSPEAPTTSRATSPLSWSEESVITVTDSVQDFGHYLDFDGDTAVIADKILGAQSVHRARIFVRSGATFTEQTKLISGVTDDEFGRAISLDGDTVLVGAKNNAFQSGAAYVFVRTGSAWTQQQKLTAPALKTYANFGSSVALDGDVALIGKPGTPGTPLTGSLEDYGAAHVYRRNGTSWIHETVLTADDVPALARLGTSAALAGTTALIGARSMVAGAGGGAAYVFVYQAGTWVREAKLVPQSSKEGDQLGAAVALCGDRAFIGAPHDSSSTGAVYVYTRSGSTWTEDTKLVASDGAAQDVFGKAISCEGSTLLVGAEGKSGAAKLIGAAYVFTAKPSGWVEDIELTGSLPIPNRALGAAVALSGSTALLGARKYGATDSFGAAYVFTGVPERANGEACGESQQCESDHCVDGVCCDAACNGPCESCVAAKKGSGIDGTCAPAAADSDPDDECAPDPGFPESCGPDGFCDGAGACRPFATKGTACGQTTCEAGSVSGLICNGGGSCVSDQAPCAPYICSGGACTASCTTNADCTNGAYCTALQTCRAKSAVGEPCGQDSECVPGAVCDEAEGVCTSNAICDGDHTVEIPGGEKVDCAPYRCNPDGTCRLTCESQSECVSPFLCNEDQSCVERPASNSDDGGCGCRTTPTRNDAWLLSLLLASWCAMRARASRHESRSAPLRAPSADDRRHNRRPRASGRAG